MTEQFANTDTLDNC